MLREMLGVLYGCMIWQGLRLRFGIGGRTVVLALVGDNKRLDFFARVHLKDFMDRKCARTAVILYTYREKRSGKESEGKKPDWKRHLAGDSIYARVHHMSAGNMEYLYDYYSFYKCSDKLVFTYTDQPADNCLGRILRETEITEEEAVCLGLYRLKEVPIWNRRKRLVHEDKSL